MLEKWVKENKRKVFSIYSSVKEEERGLKLGRRKEMKGSGILFVLMRIS